MALDGDVRKTLLDRTDAEKVFRPWWDTIEDMLLNLLIGLGKINMLHLRKKYILQNIATSFTFCITYITLDIGIFLCTPKRIIIFWDAVTK